MDENNLFLKTIEQKYERFEDYYTLMSSDFLSLEQQSMLSGFMRAHSRDGVFFYGGYDDAERKMVVFLPDYLYEGSSERLTEWFAENEDSCPLSLLDIIVPAAERKTLGHRDYLGALMGEGIKREKVGDILVSEKGAQIIIAAELADYLVHNFNKVGPVRISVKKAPIYALKSIEIQTINLKFTVSSPRIDNIIAGIFGVSRKDATFYIAHGKVFVSGREVSKPDLTLKGGEKIILRGKGKAIYKGVSGTSKKGKAYINVDKYV